MDAGITLQFSASTSELQPKYPVTHRETYLPLPAETGWYPIFCYEPQRSCDSVPTLLSCIQCWHCILRELTTQWPRRAFIGTLKNISVSNKSIICKFWSISPVDKVSQGLVRLPKDTSPWDPVNRTAKCRSYYRSQSSHGIRFQPHSATNSEAILWALGCNRVRSCPCVKIETCNYSFMCADTNVSLHR